MEIHGICKPGFEAVRDAFEANFAEGLEIGAAAAVTVDGEFVVDIWGGDADTDGTPWQRDTIVNVYSTTKTMAATCMLMLADRGELDFDAPVARYWPEFARNGKDGVLVRHVMAHTAGVPGFDPPITVEQLYDLDGVAANLAAQAPWWEPGTASGYHAISQGNLEGEILHRITGRRMADWFRTEVAEPLGADFWMSLPASEDPRVAELQPPVFSGDRLTINGVEVSADSIAVKALLSCPQTAREPATREWRAAEIPAAGGLGNARGIARIHAALACGGAVDGVRLMSEAGVRRALQEQTDGRRPSADGAASPRARLRAPARGVLHHRAGPDVLGRLGRLALRDRPERPHEHRLRDEPHGLRPHGRHPRRPHSRSRPRLPLGTARARTRPRRASPRRCPRSRARARPR